MQRVTLGLLLLVGCDRAFFLTEPPDGPPGCFGRASGGLFDFCPPTVAPSFGTQAAFDTDACEQVVAQGDAGATEACVIAAKDITIAQGMVVTGTRPLILIATHNIEVTGTLSVASRRTAPGAGSGHRDCLEVRPGNNALSTNGGGGGAGGSFQAPGGNGGSGAGGIPGGVAQHSPLPIGFVRGGCPASAGGTNTTSGAMGGVGGGGGGAVYLIAGRAIVLDGTIDASGAGGAGGIHGVGGVGGGGGGGGGGSGGLIGLDAPVIELSAETQLIANGGGGGGGGSSNTADGAPGGDANPQLNFPWLANGGDGGAATTGGDGGDGSHAELPTAQAGELASAGSGAGGGGGSTGYILVFTPGLLDNGAMSSPAFMKN